MIFVPPHCAPLLISACLCCYPIHSVCVVVYNILMQHIVGVSLLSLSSEDNTIATAPRAPKTHIRLWPRLTVSFSLLQQQCGRECLVVGGNQETERL